MTTPPSSSEPLAALGAAEESCRRAAKNGGGPLVPVMAEYDRRGEMLKGRELEQHALRNAMTTIGQLHDEIALRAGDQVQIHDAGSRRAAVVKVLGNLSMPREEWNRFP